MNLLPLLIRTRAQIIGLNDESFSIAVCIDAKEESVLGEMLGDAVGPLSNFDFRSIFAARITANLRQ